jgi:RNA polymerase sigma factor FliA
MGLALLCGEMFHLQISLAQQFCFDLIQWIAPYAMLTANRVKVQHSQTTHAPMVTHPKTTLDPADGQLVKDQMAAVKSIATQMARKLPASVERDDLIQDGLLGLIEALLRWTKETNTVHFKNYVAQRSQGAMLDGLRRQDTGSRLVRKEMRRVEQIIQQLGHTLGRRPTERDVASALGLTLTDYQRLLQDAQGYLLISLDDLGADESAQYLQRCMEENSDPLAMLQRKDLRIALAKAISLLPRRKRDLLKLYYGHDMKMHEIGNKWGLTEARISQLHTQTIAQLRVSMPNGDITSLLKARNKPRPVAA